MTFAITSGASPPNATQMIALFAVGANKVPAGAVAGATDKDVAADTGVTPTTSPTSNPTPALAPTPASLAGTVVQVVDGDIVRVELSTCIETVRDPGASPPRLTDAGVAAKCEHILHSGLTGRTSFAS